MKAMLPLSLLLLAMGGCMHFEEGRVGPLGTSVYETHYQQIADKRQAADPGTEVSPTGIDGPLTENVLNSFRGVTGNAKQVAQPIQIKMQSGGK
ncbi:hypothetical protein [Azotobacter salinestris]|uniref:hypothetical protein n=1 Tax=Azotobacter salinestris TaxID=69964 RepID=UPI0032E00404